MSQQNSASKSETGAALILAIVFLLVMGLVILALGDFAVQSASTNISVRSQAKVEATAQSAATAAIQQVRVSFTYPQTGASTQYATSLSSTPTAQLCSPPGAITSVNVYCEGWQLNTSRLVNFYVCGSSFSAATCTSPNSTAAELFASVTYKDIPDGGAPNSNSCFFISGSNFSNATCGIQMTIGQWDVRIADS